MTDHWEEAEAEGSGEMGISSTGSRDVGGKFQRDRGLNHEEVEYGRAICCNATDSVPL